MLKDRGHKGSWKGASNPNRTKKKSYGNIHSINDRGIHEIYESFGSNATPSEGSVGSGSAPSSPWSSPRLGRKSAVTVSPSLDRAASKLLPFQKWVKNSKEFFLFSTFYYCVTFKVHWIQSSRDVLFSFLWKIKCDELQFFSSLDTDDNGKLKYPGSGSITHGSELTFLEFLDLFKSFRYFHLKLLCQNVNKLSRIFQLL